jgi:hypothetical protein
MQDEPSASELLDAVITFLRDVAAPHLPPADAFDARVAINALTVVRGEITVGRAAEDRERGRLTALLGHDGDLRALNDELAAALLNGRLLGDSAPVRAHLWATTLEKLAVDQPSYSTYQRCIQKPTHSPE